MASKGSHKTEEKKYRYVPQESKESKPSPPTIKTEEKSYHYAPPEKKEGSSLTVILAAVILVFIFLSLAGFLYIFLSKPSVPPVVIPPNQTNVTGNQTNGTIILCDDACKLKLAVDSIKPEICKNITDSSIRQNCFLQLSNVSLSACIELENKSVLKDCVILHAKRNNDTRTCSYLKEPDTSPCLAAVDPCYAKSGEERAICLALGKKNYTLCGSYQECIFNYSITTRSTDACHTLTEKAEEYACRALALNTNECATLTLNSQRDLCYQVYAIRINNSNLCTRISNDSLYAVECLSHFAVVNMDYKVCDAGLFFNNRWHCYANFSLNSGNVSGCVAIDKLASTSRFSCFYNFAKNHGDPSACDLINDLGLSTSCYVGAIMNNTNLDYTSCANIGPVQWKNKCYTESAKLRNDSAFCDYIQTENEKNSCLSEFTK